MQFYSDIPHFSFVKGMLYLQTFLTNSFETRYVYEPSRGIFLKNKYNSI